MEASTAAEWANNYNRKCEACQTMIVSGIWTRSMIGQQEVKRIEQERQEAVLVCYAERNYYKDVQENARYSNGSDEQSHANLCLQSSRLLSLRPAAWGVH